MTTTALHQLLDLSASRFPSKLAVEESEGGSIRYGELARLSDRVRDRLRQMGVEPGDRVGMCLRKSADAVASTFGILKAGAAYVPVDPTAPASRNAYILDNCSVASVVVERRFEERLRAEMQALGRVPSLLVVDDVGAGRGLGSALDREDRGAPAPAGPSSRPSSS